MMRTFTEVKDHYKEKGFDIYKSGDRKYVAIKDHMVFVAKNLKELISKLTASWNFRPLPDYSRLLNQLMSSS